MIEDAKIRVFLSLVKNKSTKKTALDLGISQSAVSQSLSRLESDLGGVKLFNRLNKEGLILTKEGYVLLDIAKRIQHSYDVVNYIFLSFSKKKNMANIRIAIHPLLSNTLLPLLLRNMINIHPHITIETVSFSDQYDLSFSLSKTEANLVNWDNLHKAVGGFFAGIYYSPSNIRLVKDLRDSDKLPFSTLSGIHISNKFAIWSGYRPYLSQDIINRTVLFSDSSSAILDLVSKSDNLIAVLPSINFSESYRLKSLNLNIPDLQFDLIMDFKEEFRKSEFFSLVQEALNQFRFDF